MIDRFLLAIMAVIGLAWVWPEPGALRGFWTLNTMAHGGVSLIFLFYGLRLSPEKMRTGLRNMRLHLLVQSSTFLIFPLLILPFYWGARHGEHATLWLGIYFLACLPSTVSSSVVMVSIAKGNIAGAIFNASLSALIGVLVTPLWMAIAIGAMGHGSDLGSVVGKLALQVLLPVGVGIALHSRWGNWAQKHSKALKSDQTVILLIIYTAFSDSFTQNLFAGFSGLFLVLLSLGMIALFITVFAIITALANLLKLERIDRITAVFCGSKKSLVHGTVMANILFAGNSQLGMILMPLMIYHALQIAMSSVIARKIGSTE